jgi:predicted peptidase
MFNKSLQSTFLKLTVLFLVAAGPVFAADMSERFQARVYRNKKFSSLPYRLLVPVTYDRAKKYPLVLFLHGVGERGSDNRIQLYCGLDIFAEEKRMKRYPCFIVAPQCPSDTKWAEVDWKADRHTMQKKPTPALAMAMELLNELQKEFSIDSSRIYITGYSMGGFGAWEAIQRWPDYFAAAVPVCGGGDEALAPRLVGIPIWAFHGALDNVVKVTRSRNMINAVVRAGGMPRYSEYTLLTHLCWNYCYTDEAMFDWLFRQKK